jgi:hypothetical protein
MPNPLVKIGPQSTSKTPSRPQPLEPEPEAYAGDNFPYRGTQTHGVEPLYESAPELEYGEGRLVEYEEPETKAEQAEPIPVRIVQEAGRELRMANAVVQTAYGTGKGVRASRILGRDDKRSSATIKNLNTATVWLGHTEAAAKVGSGFPLEDGQDYTTQSQGEWFAAIDQVDDAPVYVVVEYAVHA